MKNALYFIFFFSAICWSQNEKSILTKSTTFSSSDGYLISNPYHSIYDSSGWLWILGENKLSNVYVFNEKEIIIQRFDGAHFFTLKIPKNKDSKIKEGRFFKYGDKGLYLKLYYENTRAELIYIDVETLEMQPVDDYNGLNSKYLISEEYYKEDHTRLIITSKDKFYSAELDKLKLKFIDSIAFNKPVVEPFIAERRATDNFTLVKLLFEEDGCYIDNQGKIIKKITKTDFVDLQGNKFFPEHIISDFQNGKDFYYYITDYENVFKYDKNIDKYIEVENTGSDYNINSIFNYNAHCDKAFINQEGSDYGVYQLYSFKDLKSQLLTSFKIPNYSKSVSKEIGKDVVILNGNTLISYVFKEIKIKTFLKDKSIRTIKKLRPNQYIVATDSEGFYLIDVLKNTEDRIIFSSDNKEITLNYTRDIFIERDHTLITADVINLYTFDENYRVIEERSKKVLGSEMVKIKDTIFIANPKGAIHRYGLNIEEYARIPDTEDFEVKEFTTNDGVLYATTSKGIFEYQKGKWQTFKFENENTDHLLSINYVEGYGVLVSTKLGKVYTFDTLSKKLILLYEDELQASIVGMVADDNKNLWLNSYAGIVSLDYYTKEVVRYTTKEGVYELEGNRYSTYKDPEGNIFMGSFKGLSYFNPSDLVLNDVSVQLQFSSISFFNSKSDHWEINTSPHFLKNTKEIILPSEYRRFSVTTSIFGEMNPINLNYRYRLLNEDSNSDWFTNIPGKEILYANLAAGNYILQIEVLDASNNKIGKTLELKIFSSEVFYKSWWFGVLIFLLTLGVLVYSFYQYRLKENLSAKNELALNEAKIKNYMMLEIHHRIKNNLQIVSGLLGLQMVDTDSEELKIKLRDSQNRIESIAGIHDLLYNSERKNTISIRENVQNIVAYYKKLFPLNVTYLIGVDNSIMNIDQATPFSLLLNELINNSYKHAFAKAESQPEITINFYKEEESYRFEYFDNGTFKKRDESKKTMGMRIVKMMNKQLKGTIETTQDPNFKLTLLFAKNE